MTPQIVSVAKDFAVTTLMASAYFNLSGQGTALCIDWIICRILKRDPAEKKEARTFFYSQTVCALSATVLTTALSYTLSSRLPIPRFSFKLALALALTHHIVVLLLFPFPSLQKRISIAFSLNLGALHGWLGAPLSPVLGLSGAAMHTLIRLYDFLVAPEHLKPLPGVVRFFGMPTRYMRLFPLY